MSFYLAIWLQYEKTEVIKKLDRRLLSMKNQFCAQKLRRGVFKRPFGRLKGNLRASFIPNWKVHIIF